MQAVKELTLKCPFKLRMVQITRMKLEIIGMHWNVGILEPDDDLDPLPLAAGGKVEQRMLVEPQLLEYTVEACVGRLWHKMILTEPVPVN